MPCTFSRLGSLVMNENQPSTSPVVSGVGSNCTVTLVTLDSSMLLTFRNAVHTASLVAWMPIFLPIMSWGVLIGLLASDITQNGFFWYCAATITRSAPLLTADAVMS